MGLETAQKNQNIRKNYFCFFFPGRPSLLITAIDPTGAFSGGYAGERDIPRHHLFHVPGHQDRPPVQDPSNPASLIFRIRILPLT